MINDVLTWLPVTHSDPISVQMEMSQDVSRVQMSRILLARLHHTSHPAPCVTMSTFLTSSLQCSVGARNCLFSYYPTLTA